MDSNHFVVSQRDSVWQFSYKGDVTGPFTSKAAAIDAAIVEAGTLEETVEVVVRDADMRNQTIWRTGENDLTHEETENLADAIERDNDA